MSALTDLPGTWLIAPDMPGHGPATDENPDRFEFDYFADKVVDLMDKLDIEKADVGGLSMGSGIALNIALRYSSRVNRLVLLRPSWLDQVQPAHLEIVAKVGRWIEEDPSTAWSKLESDEEFKKIQDECLGAAHSISDLLERPQDPASTRVLYKMWESKPIEKLDGLSYLSQDTIVFDTDADPLHPKSVAKTIADKIPQAQYASLPPRYINGLAYQTALNEAIRDFLSHQAVHA